MKKSAVLKDLSNRPQGYFCCEKDGVSCRVQLHEPAQAAIVFADGSQRIFEFPSSGAEQFFACNAETIDCIYVFRGKELLMISDRAAKLAFEKRQGLIEKTEKKEAYPPEAKRREIQEESLPAEPFRSFAQRRWPPPPAWETACYSHGVWQENDAPPD